MVDDWVRIREEADRIRKQDEEERNRKQREEADRIRKANEATTESNRLVQLEADRKATQAQQDNWDRERQMCLTELENLRRDNERHIWEEADLRNRLLQAERAIEEAATEQRRIEQKLEEDAKQRLIDKLPLIAEHAQ